MFIRSLVCPVCKEEFLLQGASLICKNHHCFDISKFGHVNLLSSSKPGALMGDSSQMANSRHQFLQRGAFQKLKDEIYQTAKSQNPDTVLDICCGEGYYSFDLADKLNAEVYGFDLSKHMIIKAAKRKAHATYFVANLSKIPIKNASVDFAFHLFAPFSEAEFARVLSDNGTLISVVPGSRHMFGLKSLLYEKPYLNDEKLPQTEQLKLKSVRKLSYKFCLENQSQIWNMFQMTPYFYHTDLSAAEKLKNIDNLQEEFEFIIGEYTK